MAYIHVEDNGGIVFTLYLSGKSTSADRKHQLRRKLIGIYTVVDVTLEMCSQFIYLTAACEQDMATLSRHITDSLQASSG